eukprot:87114-Chlamydomonas_euryale.AAC.1
MLRGGCGRAPPRRPSASPWCRLQSGSYGPPGSANPRGRRRATTAGHRSCGPLSVRSRGSLAGPRLRTEHIYT